MNQIIKSIMAIFMVFLMMMAFTGSAIATKENPTEKKSVIIMFKDKPDRDLIKHHGGDIKTVYHIKPAIAASIPQEAIDGLNRNPKIDYIVNDLEIFTVEETLPWGVDRIDADIVHEYNKGTGVNVAILDSGIDYEHPDLVNNYIDGYDFGGDYRGAPNDDDPMDYSGHGTHVAGTVAAVKGNNEGVIGVAPEADLYILKVFADDGSGHYSDVIEALERCIDTRGDDGDPTNDIQIISMSIGSSYNSGDPLIEPWIDAAYDAGILLVGAAGNDGRWNGRGDNVIYPARYNNVIAVAATDSNDNRASFSSTGPDVELAAPGVNILSTLPGGTYGYKMGTSMACPHVTGTAALVIASDPLLSNDQVRQILRDTADYLGDPYKYGYGLVDADGAAPPTEIPNQLPVADAGLDQTATVGET
ncbi:MAG: S8 family serine peptidase, partial [Gammaproteobacteria bacterium]|nr:S8 family serine peptidase [Gammaproteobacteria bacterium]